MSGQAEDQNTPAETQTASFVRRRIGHARSRARRSVL